MKFENRSRSVQSVRSRAWGAVAIAALLFAFASPALAGGGYTTFDAVKGGCLDGPNGVDCNNYAAKEDVYTSGGPAHGSGLPDGSYYFTVLAPGSQHGGFLDGADGNLSFAPSCLTDLSSASCLAIASRTFILTNNVITSWTAPTGTAPNGQLILQLAPYDNTPNIGNVYILAICQSGATSSSQCKFDAFRVPPSEPPPTPQDLVVVKNATATFDRTYGWTITKSVDTSQITGSSPATFHYTVTVSHDAGTDSNWGVNGEITVVNPNSASVTVGDVTVTDATSPDVASVNVAATGTDTTILSVPPAGSATASYTGTYATAPAATLQANTATATWIDFGSPSTSASFVVNFTFPTAPTTVKDRCVTVTDANAPGGTLGTVCVGDAGESNGTFTFTYEKTFEGDPAGTCTPHANTATFTTDTTGTTGSASVTVTHCVGADLVVSKTASAGFGRTYFWMIDKSVTPPLVEQIGGTATFTYTVLAAETGFVDAGWYVAGAIQVTNPNNFESITANVADSIDNGGTCTVVGGTGAVVGAGTSTVLAYGCTYGAAPAYGVIGTNTATATWNAAAAGTPNGSASGTAPYLFALPTTTVHQTVTITDSFNGGAPSVLGTLTAADGLPFTTATYTYTRTVNVPANNCVTVPNVATIVETGQTSSASVEVCGPAKTGALTIGFWQNKNGQGIISGGSSTSGVCNSGTWLRQYAPYQDLSATATCSQVASYVYGVIKAANASGSSMNAMLKAQMLATSLDVYFSDAALGGNRINAPGAIGGVVIDLTKICHMIDGSGGGASCSGSYENVSSSFGGASSLSVSGMILFASSQSNSGGSFWYGNVKATQGLAKDAFDAVNNSVAFAP